jgi:hypothetical protein
MMAFAESHWFSRSPMPLKICERYRLRNRATSRYALPIVAYPGVWGDRAVAGYSSANRLCRFVQIQTAGRGRSKTADSTGQRSSCYICPCEFPDKGVPNSLLVRIARVWLAPNVIDFTKGWIGPAAGYIVSRSGNSLIDSLLAGNSR